MFGHLPELVIIMVLALVVFGPEKLPEVASSAGKMVRELRQALDVGLNPEDVDVPSDFASYYYDSTGSSTVDREEPEDLSGEAYPFSGDEGLSESHDVPTEIHVPDEE